MILGYSNKIRILSALLFLVLLPWDLNAHVPGAPREVPPASATPNTKAPVFVLLNQEGNRFDSTTLRGKVIVLNFIFTTCTDVCPLFTAILPSSSAPSRMNLPATSFWSASPPILKWTHRKFSNLMRNDMVQIFKIGPS